MSEQPFTLCGDTHYLSFGTSVSCHCRRERFNSSYEHFVDRSLIEHLTNRIIATLDIIKFLTQMPCHTKMTQSKYACTQLKQSELLFTAMCAAHTFILSCWPFSFLSVFSTHPFSSFTSFFCPRPALTRWLIGCANTSSGYFCTIASKHGFKFLMSNICSRKFVSLAHERDSIFGQTYPIHLVFNPNSLINGNTLPTARAQRTWSRTKRQRTLVLNQVYCNDRSDLRYTIIWCIKYMQ